jgi:hypothetical protein
MKNIKSSVRCFFSPNAVSGYKIRLVKKQKALAFFSTREGSILRKENECGTGALPKSALCGITPQGKTTLSVHLTEFQKTELEVISSDWGIEMAMIGRRLIRYLIGNKVTLLELLQKYQAGVAAERFASRLPESRNHRICIRLRHDEKQKLNVLANQWFYLPGELARILLELFIMGVIEKSDIWD